MSGGVVRPRFTEKEMRPDPVDGAIVTSLNACRPHVSGVSNESTESVSRGDSREGCL